VVKQQLAPALAWRLECERPALLPLAAPQVMISASSADDLEQLMSTQERRNVHAVALAFGAAPHNSDRVMELLWPSVQQLRLLTVAGSVDMPSDFFERLMGANSTLVVAWYCDRNSDRSHWRANIMSVSV
jgi:hypothetical protein